MTSWGVSRRQCLRNGEIETVVDARVLLQTEDPLEQPRGTVDAEMGLHQTIELAAQIVQRQRVFGFTFRNGNEAAQAPSLPG